MKLPIDMTLDNLEWKHLPTSGDIDPIGGLPYATHEAVLDLGGFKIKCFQLSDGQRVLDCDDLARFFGIEPEEENANS